MLMGRLLINQKRYDVNKKSTRLALSTVQFPFRPFTPAGYLSSYMA